MDHGDNKHCTETEFSCRYHYHRYKDNTVESACGVNDNPSRIVLKPKSQSYPSIDFEMPRQRHELEKVEQMMALAYRRGQLDQMLKIRTTLRDIIGL